MVEVYYRKWRPRRLDEVVGQEAVTQTLRQAVSLGRVAHAYLFCGPRGTGKTSTARILAKAVNCLSAQNGEPDNSCELCLAVDQGRALDLIEIDAASNRGIDDIRELSDKIHYTPNEGSYKVYIIDEVHMLTEPAFNALLKTLEEPPPHAILVLATTEAHKVPLTVISRCQRFDFRRISSEAAIGKLEELCGEEAIEIEGGALALIARASGGSLRDAENLLEQAVVSYGSPVTEEQLRGLLGLGGDEMALDLTDHVIRRQPTEGLKLIGRVAEQGSDLRQLHRGVMDYLRGALLVKTGADGSLSHSAEALGRLAAMAEATTVDHLVRSLRTYAAIDMRRDASSPLPLEVALVEVCTEPEKPAAVDAAPPPTGGTADSPAGYVAERARPRRTPPAPARPRQQPSGETGRRYDNRWEEQGPPPAEPAARLEHQWHRIVSELRHAGTRFKLGALLRGCRERTVSDETITLSFPYASHVERMQSELDDPQTRGRLKEVLTTLMDRPYEVQVRLADDSGGSPGRSVAGRSNLVRAAQAMGARVVGEKEDDTDGEQEDDPPSAAVAATYGEDAGGA